MTSNWTIRILAGLVAVALVVLGIGLLGGDDGDGGDDAAQTVAAGGATGATGSGDTKAGARKRGEGKGKQSQSPAQGPGATNERSGSAAGEASPESEEEIRRLQEERAAASEMSEDEKEAQVRAQRFYDILGSEKGDKNSTEFDSESFCELMSEEAREQTIDYAKRSSGIDQEWNCENSVELLVIRSKRTGGFKQTRNAEIVGVNAEGDRATATVRFGKGPLTSIPLVKEDGEWKLGSSTSGAANEDS